MTSAPSAPCPAPRCAHASTAPRPRQFCIVICFKSNENTDINRVSICVQVTTASKGGGNTKTKSGAVAELRTLGARGRAGQGGQLVGSENRVAPGQHRPIVTQISASPLLSSFPTVLLRSGGQRVRRVRRRRQAHCVGGGRRRQRLRGVHWRHGTDLPC